MIGATAKAEQFYTRSGSEATKGSRKGYSLLGEGESPLVVLTEKESIESVRASLKGQLKAAQEDHATAKIAMRMAFGTGDAYFIAKGQWERAGKAIVAICAELSKIKGARKDPANVQRHFVNICRDTMTWAQFNRILTEANARAKEDEA